MKAYVKALSWGRLQSITSWKQGLGIHLISVVPFNKLVKSKFQTSAPHGPSPPQSVFLSKGCVDVPPTRSALRAQNKEHRMVLPLLITIEHPVFPHHVYSFVASSYVNHVETTFPGIKWFLDRFQESTVLPCGTYHNCRCSYLIDAANNYISCTNKQCQIHLTPPSRFWLSVCPKRLVDLQWLKQSVNSARCPFLTFGPYQEPLTHKKLSPTSRFFVLSPSISQTKSDQ